MNSMMTILYLDAHRAQLEGEARSRRLAADSSIRVPLWRRARPRF